MFKQGARAFSSFAKSFIEFTWKGTSSIEWVEKALKEDIKGKPKLSIVVHARAKGGIHPSKKDPADRATLQLFDKDDRRVTSVHVYVNGKISYSDALFNTAEPFGDGTKIGSISSENAKEGTG